MPDNSDESTPLLPRSRRTREEQAKEVELARALLPATHRGGFWHKVRLRLAQVWRSMLFLVRVDSPGSDPREEHSGALKPGYGVVQLRRDAEEPAPPLE